MFYYDVSRKLYLYVNLSNQNIWQPIKTSNHNIWETNNVTRLHFFRVRLQKLNIRHDTIDIANFCVSLNFAVVKVSGSHWVHHLVC